MQETMWAVAGGIIIGGSVLWLLRASLALLFQGGRASSLGGVLILIAGLILAWYVIGGQVFGIYFDKNTMMHR